MADPGTTYDPPTKAAPKALQLLDQEGVPVETLDISEITLLQIHEQLLRARKLGETAQHLTEKGETAVYGGVLGAEAASISPMLALDDEDWVVPARWDVCATLCRGASMEEIFAHLLGMGAANNQGRTRPDLFMDPARRIAGVSGLLGAQISHAVGLAWAAKLDGSRLVALGFFGDLATSGGDFHVGANFAGVFETPCVLICRSRVGQQGRQSAAQTFAAKAIAYGIEGVKVDGNDPIAMYQSTVEAVQRARAGEGATLIEAAVTSLDEDRDADPLGRLQRYLLAAGLLTEEEISAGTERVRQEIDEALIAARAGSPPSRHSLTEDVYKDRPWHLQEQAMELDEPG